MSTRSAAETVARIFLAFSEQSTWPQAELARRVGVGTQALRRRLDELRRTGQMALEREEEHPHVYWSVSRGWAPGGVTLTGQEALQVLRLLARLPRSVERDRFVKRLTGHFGSEPATNTTPLRGNEQTLETVVEAASSRTALEFDYFSSHRGDRRVRFASVHEVMGGDHWRFVATCHERRCLCWFRVDNVLSARLAPQVPFQAADEVELKSFLNTSIDGFAGSGAPVPCWFVVRYPEARWVKINLPEQEAFRTESVEGGLKFQATTTALDPVARFVVGLGDAVTFCAPPLAGRVRSLADGALARLGASEDGESSR